MRTVLTLFTLLGVIVGAVAACAPNEGAYWRNISKHVGETIERH